MRAAWGLAALIGLAVFGNVPGASAKDYQAVLVPSDKEVESDPDLYWKFRKLNVQVSMEGDELSPVVLIKGIFERKGSSLVWNKQVLKKAGASTSNFLFRLPLTGEVTPVLLKVSGGGVEKDVKISVVFHEFSDFRKTNPKEIVIRQKRFNFYLSLGPTYVFYQEDSVPAFHYTALTTKISLSYFLFPPRWDLAFNAFITALSLSQTDLNVDPRPEEQRGSAAGTSRFYSSPNANTIKPTVRFLGVNGRIGYAFPFVSPPWKLSLHAGWYLATMLVSSSVMGYRNMVGPQIFPMISRTFSGGSTMFLYAKFSPILGLTFSNREIATGLGYLVMLKNGHPVTFNLDYANLYFRFSSVNLPAPVTVQSNSLSFSLGYGL